MNTNSNTIPPRWWVVLDRTVVVLALLGWGLMLFAAPGLLPNIGSLFVGLGLGYMGRATWDSSQ